MIGGVPVADEEGVIGGGLRERDRNEGAAEDSYTSKSTGGFVECKRGKIEVTSDLILHLKPVGEVLARRDWACCSVHSVLVRILPLLNSIPTLDSKQSSIFNGPNP